MIPRGTTFEFEYLGEFEMEINNILEHELGAHMRLIHEKNQRPKISCYCTFKARFGLSLSSYEIIWAQKPKVNYTNEILNGVLLTLSL
jgi:hypothetical protein